MAVLRVEHLAAAILDLGGAGGALALGPVAVAAGAAAEPTVLAAFALFHQAAEGDGVAALDGGHGAPLPSA